MRQKLTGVVKLGVDSSEYFNIDPLTGAAKIVLHRQSPDKFLVYSHEGALLDSVPLKSGKYASLMKEKEDVFLLYRGWLELQWQQAADGKRQYAAWWQKLNSGSYRPVSSEQSKRQLLNVAIDLHKRQIAIDNKISSLVVPEEESVEQLVAGFYRNETSEISYLPALDFAYTINYIRGQRI